MLRSSRNLALNPRIPWIVQERLASEATKNVFAVVVGGGVVGTSVAYHLTKRNIRDVIVLEKGSLASGTTHHSPGSVSASHPAHRYKPILAYSVDLYSRLEEETGEKVGFVRTGTVRLATNATRMEEFRRYVARDYFQKGDACKTSLINADEVKEIAPILDTSKIFGALFTSGDGYISAEGLTRAFAKGAQTRGAEIIEQCPPAKFIENSETGEWIVQLEDGREFCTRHVVNAAGLWASEVGRLTNLKIPLVHLEHQYAAIGPINELASMTDLPAIIDHDSTFYVRPYGDKLLFGGFENRPSDVVIREDWYKKMPQDAKVKPNFERLRGAYNGACDLIPALNEAEVSAKASAFTMTADGYPLVGPTSHRQNYWLMAGFFDGVSSGGGMGRYLADWIIDEEPPTELFDTDANRFDRWASRNFIREKSRETYSMYYNWSYTNRLAGRPTERVSGIYARLAKEGGVFSFRNGWEVPQAFAVHDEPRLPAMIREYQMVSNKCGLIDLTWKGKIEVRGTDAKAFLERVLTGPVPPLGSIASSLMLTRRGNLLAPFKVFHHDQFRDEFILLSDPERESRDLFWLQRAAEELKMRVDISAVSEYLSSLALVGPCSRDVLQELIKADISDAAFPQRTTRLVRIDNVPVVAARTSTTTGQLTYELFHNRADSLRVYNALMKGGKNFGIVNFGQTTHNMMRIEHGYKLWGRELTLNTNPYECGLGHMVDLSKKDFIGKASAAEMSKRQWNRKQVMLACEPLKEMQDWRNIPQGMEVIRKEGEEERIGQITSGTYSVRLQKPLAFAWINSDITTNDKLTIDTGSGRISACVLEKPPICDAH